jgi:hypothetical protein
LGSVAAGITTATVAVPLPSTTYNWWVRANCGAGSTSIWVSGGSFTTLKVEPTNQATAFAVTTASVNTAVIPLTWTASTGGVLPDGYLLKAGTSATFADPVDGTDPGAGSLSLATLPASYKSTGTSATFTGGTAGTMYYFKNYAYTNSGTNINFKINGTVPVLNYATKPAVVTNTAYNIVNDQNTTINWTLPASYAAANHTVLVFVKDNSTIQTGVLTNGPATYTANSTLGSGTPYQLDPEAYNVYKGTGTSVNVSGLVANHTYFVTIVVVMNAANYDGTFSNSVNVDSNVFIGYCTPSSTGGKYITAVTVTGGLSDINRTSTQGAAGYQDFTISSASAIQGGTVNFSVTTNNTAFLNIWVDWDNNYVFSDTEKMFSSTVTTTAPNTGTFTVPVNAPAGNHRMRIRNGANVNPASCGALNGEAEDYTFTVVQAPMPTITSVSPDSYCQASGVVTITGTNLLNATLKIGSVTITPLTTNTATQIVATVNSGVSGAVSVTTPGGTVTGQNFAVNAAPALTLSQSTISVCEGSASALITITAGRESYDTYTVSSSPAGAPYSGNGTSGFTFSPTVATVYTIIASQSAGNCTTTASLSTNIVAVPAPVVVAPANSTVCSGIVQQLTATGGNRTQILLRETFDAASTQFTASAAAGTVSATLNTTYRAQGAGSILFNASTNSSANLEQSAAINLTSYSSAQLTFSHIAAMEDFQDTYDAGFVEYSIDGGVNWLLFPTSSYAGSGTLITDIATETVSGVIFSTKSYPEWIARFTSATSTPGTAPATSLWKTETINIPASALSSTQFKIRFGYDTDNTYNYYGWLIDNVAITATAQGGYVWTSNNPAATIYTDAAATTPYTGSGAASVYVKPSETTVYTATVTNSAGCLSAGTSTVTVTPNTWTGAADSNWNNPANWCGNQVPTATDAAVIPDVTTLPVLSAGMNIQAQSLTVQNGVEFIIPSGANLTLTNALNVSSDADFIIRNNGNLLQVNNVANTGEIAVHRDSSPLFRQDYTMWSSPVAGQNLLNFSPGTLPNRFYIYDTANNAIANSTSGLVNPANDFEAGKGYLIRMPNEGSAEYNNIRETRVFDGTFIGEPHNGNVPVILSGAGSGFNLIGNPYPSPIRIADFFTANNGDPLTAADDKIEGTIWIWRKKNDPTNNSSYITMNRAGIYTNNNQPNTGTDPMGIIRTGQGFIVRTTALGAASTTPVQFTNAMRSTNTSNTFFRNDNDNLPESHGMWLNLTSETGTFSQMYTGYIAGATSGFDNGIDSRFINDSQTVLSSLVGEVECIIQGRALPFSTENTEALQLRASAAGTYTITLDHVSGLFAGDQDIYLKDNLVDAVHDLKEGPYTFATDAGTFADRFQVIYSNEVLGTDNPVANANTVVVYKQSENLHINTGKEVMAGVKIFDIRGRLVYEQKDINASETVMSNLKVENQMLIVQVTTNNNVVVTKKVLY